MTTNITLRDTVFDEWQPIETAKQDESHILAAIPYEYSPDGWLIYVIKWDKYLGKWIEADGEQYQAYEPTHWKPRPTPPTQVQT
jgi:hypothetical protein